jgi:hypothetical protein
LVVAPLSGSELEERVKVAAGQYKIFGPAGEKIEGDLEAYEEDWVLYRVADGYLVESHASFSSIDGDYSWVDRFLMNQGMVLRRWEMAGTGHSEEGEQSVSFGCDLGLSELWCWDSDGQGNSFPVRPPYGLLPLGPLSPWLAATWIHAVDLPEAANDSHLTLVVFDMPDGPNDLLPSEWLVSYLGASELELGNTRVEARKFRLAQPPDNEQDDWVPIVYIIYISPEGLVLSWETESVETDVPMLPGATKLVNYEQYAEFGPGVE